ncbi:hypothetical protein [Lancefieldella parvula]|uniref:hypothetical protein n=1 Tax=Lancefieldella parvula TaxID=1382 RepID=UPI0028805B22|nr:hypothetical protein [Lancefieldella parvula]
MRIITLVIGKKGAGKSTWIFKKKDKMLFEGWEQIDAEKEEDYNQAIFALKSPTGEVAILNSGSDSKDIIDEFGTFLAKHKEATQIFTAIRPQDINPCLHKRMKEVLSIQDQDDENVERIEL